MLNDRVDGNHRRDCAQVATSVSTLYLFGNTRVIVSCPSGSIYLFIHAFSLFSVSCFEVEAIVGWMVWNHLTARCQRVDSRFGGCQSCYYENGYLLNASDLTLV